MTRPFVAKSVQTTSQEEAKGGMGYGKFENGQMAVVLTRSIIQAHHPYFLSTCSWSDATTMCSQKYPNYTQLFQELKTHCFTHSFQSWLFLPGLKLARWLVVSVSCLNSVYAQISKEKLRLHQKSVSLHPLADLEWIESPIFPIYIFPLFYLSIICFFYMRGQGCLSPASAKRLLQFEDFPSQGHWKAICRQEFSKPWFHSLSWKWPKSLMGAQMHKCPNTRSITAINWGWSTFAFATWCLAARNLVFGSSIWSSTNSALYSMFLGRTKCFRMIVKVSPILIRPPQDSAKIPASFDHPQKNIVVIMLRSACQGRAT